MAEQGPRKPGYRIHNPVPAASALQERARISFRKTATPGPYGRPATAARTTPCRASTKGRAIRPKGGARHAVETAIPSEALAISCSCSSLAAQCRSEASISEAAQSACRTRRWAQSGMPRCRIVSSAKAATGTSANPAKRWPGAQSTTSRVSNRGQRLSRSGSLGPPSSSAASISPCSSRSDSSGCRMLPHIQLETGDPPPQFAQDRRYHGGRHGVIEAQPQR